MNALLINGVVFKASERDAWISGLLPLWDTQGNVRSMPRNIQETAIIWASVWMLAGSLPVFWLLSHIPLLGVESNVTVACLIALSVCYRPYSDVCRAIMMIIICSLLLSLKVTWGLTIFEFHIEKYIYGLGNIASLGTISVRLFNKLCWYHIDRICLKYNIPLYDQKTLMDNYEGHDTHFGETPIVHDNYSDAIKTKQANG